MLTLRIRCTIIYDHGMVVSRSATTLLVTIVSAHRAEPDGSAR